MAKGRRQKAEGRNGSGTFGLLPSFILAVTAQTFFLLALVGQLRPIPILIVLVAAASVLAWRARWRIAWPVVAFATAAIPMALLPPVAFDETLYHLPFVRALAESGQLRFVTEFRFPVFPQLHELLCVPLYLIGDGTATHFMALAETLVTVAILVAWGRRHHAGALAAALFAGSPLIMLLATITHVDAALTMFVTAGFYCIDRRKLSWAGFLLGTACGVKYLGLFFAAAALAYIVWRRRSPLRFAVCFLAGALPVTLWLTITTGNPVFPFFGHSAWNLPLEHVTLANHIERVLRLPFDVTFARARINQQPPVTPFLIPMLIAVVLAALRDRRARFVAAMTVAYVIAFSFLPQDPRYLVPLLPLVSLVAAAQWRSASRWLALLAIAPGLLYPAYAFATRGWPFEPREELILRRDPEVAALRHADARTVYVCGAEQLKFYARGTLIGDHAGPYAFSRILPPEWTTSAIAARLQPIGVTWFLNATRKCPRPRDDGGMELVYEDAAAQLWRMPSRR